MSPLAKILHAVFLLCNNFGHVSMRKRGQEQGKNLLSPPVTFHLHRSAKPLARRLEELLAKLPLHNIALYE